MKKHLTEIGMVGFIVLFFAQMIIGELLGNNYRDVYDPFWINVAGFLLLASFVWVSVFVVLDSMIGE